MEFTRQSILQFLCAEFGIDPTTIDDNTPLISSGIIDSLGVMDFVGFISQAANVVVAGSDVRLINLDTVNSVLTFVASKVTG